MTDGRSERMKSNSLLYWYPKIRDLGIPTPRTICQPVEGGAMEWLDGEIPPNRMQEFYAIANRLGYPVFIRTGHLSGKHEWDRVCYVKNKDDLEGHIRALVDTSYACDFMGLPVDSIVFREFIQMDSKYTAFVGFPVSPERRYFINQGKILCHHPYWIEEAIWGQSNPDWQKLSQEMNTESSEEVKLLSEYALRVAAVMPEYWSVDFCKAKDGRWFLIDMGRGEDSFHDPTCNVLKQTFPEQWKEMDDCYGEGRRKRQKASDDFLQSVRMEEP